MTIKPSIKILLALMVMLFSYCFINFALSVSIVRAISHSDWSQAVRITIMVLASFVLFSSCLIFSHKWLRYILLIVFAVSAIINEVFNRIEFVRVDIDSIAWLVQETNQTGNVIQSYTYDVLMASSMVISGLLIASIAASVIRTQAQDFINQRWRTVLAVTAISMLLAWNVLLLLLVAYNHPEETSILAYGVFITVIPEAKGADVTERPSPSVFNKVVLVVDESVRYDFFETVLGDEVKRLNAIDFGEATAFSPCSASSNAILRWGFSKDRQFVAGEDPRENPKIWRYAKAAGFKTHLLDGQTNGRPQNWVGKDEQSSIDDFQPLKQGIDTDKVLAKEINSLLKQDSHDFIYVIKKGSHFSYEHNYPEAMRSNIKTRSQSYIAAITYSTAGFFTEALAGVDMNKVLMIYTSDHGQRLDGSGASHCNAITKQGEYSVPLVAFTGNTQWHSELGQASNTYRGTTTHLQIFSTLLASLGYDRHQSADRYAPALFDAPDSSRYILEYPFTPFPNLRTGKIPLKRVSSFSEIGAADDGNDPLVDWAAK